MQSELLENSPNAERGESCQINVSMLRHPSMSLNSEQLVIKQTACYSQWQFGRQYVVCDY